MEQEIWKHGSLEDYVVIVRRQILKRFTLILKHLRLPESNYLIIAYITQHLDGYCLCDCVDMI
jgi:hypothetical protein